MPRRPTPVPATGARPLPAPAARPRQRTAWLWWAYGIASAAWITAALVLFPQRWQDDQFWAALMATDDRVLTVEQCGHVIDTEVARGCRQLERMAREREQNRREEALLSAFGSVGTVIGPPLLVLFGAFLVTAVLGDRLNRRPPPRRETGGPGADSIRLPPTTYRPPHRRHHDTP